MTSVRFLDPAEAELEEAISYFNQQREGLGERFRREVEASVARVVDHPHIGMALSRKVRKFRVRKFSYNVIYGLVESEVLIIAIAHHKRRPRYWRSRLWNF